MMGWLSSASLRDGRIGLVPLAAVLSFLRQEGTPYHLVVGRAGKHASEWTVAGLSGFTRAAIRVAPPALRARLVMRVARLVVHSTCRSSRRASVLWRKVRGAVHILGSIFCRVRGPVEEPLCEFYASAIRRLMSLFALDFEVAIEQCLATGAADCLMEVGVRSAEAGG